jgi:nitroreductase/FMN reductase [NAD(P)H]
MHDDITRIQQTLQQRFGDLPHDVPVSNATLDQMAARGSCREFTEQPVADDLIHTLCAVALSSPSKSDLQQRDIVIIREHALRESINALFDHSNWIHNAPSLLIFCANNRRQRQLASWRETTFANDHLDAFFNASVDAGIALSAFVTAAESVGLGCCPISQIRDHCEVISELLHLPEWVFPVAGLGLGWPAQPGEISLRLPLSVTVHENRFSEASCKDKVDEYDRRRDSVQPYQQQRDTETFGVVETYGWSEDKARQYNVPQRTDFGTFIKEKGFVLD